MSFELASHFVELNVADDGSARLSEAETGASLTIAGPLASVRIGVDWYDACGARDLGAGRLHLSFAGGVGGATVLLIAKPGYIVVEVESVDSSGVEELRFVDMDLLATDQSQEDGFAVCVLALDLQTNVTDIPGRGVKQLRASCYERFGMAGARAALVGAPAGQLRIALQEAVRDDLQLPYSTIGGPFALDAPVNRGSYLFNFDGITLDNVDAWIELAGTLGFDQIDFHGGRSFRFGDCRPDPELYPGGFNDLKAVIDRLHDAGIRAGLHTYAFFIDKACGWVSPVPDPRLGKDASFTLAAALSAGTTDVQVEQDTTKMSTTTGFFVRDSVTLQVDDELILYSGVGAHGFTGCERGAWGTQAAAHAAGATVHHLKECFGLFTPDAESSLLADVAAASATAFNACGFDMIYLDALDGEDILGGADASWHWGSRFVLELWQRLERPALMEMSTFHHHLWYVRSRMGAWDHPRRSHKRFIDIHCESNLACDRMFLPANLGWWAFKTFTGVEGEPTFADDIEYWCGKAIGTGAGLSLMGIDPTVAPETPALPRLAAIVRRYEDLRRSGLVSPTVQARLAEPGAEFTLEGEGEQARFYPVHSGRHKIEALQAWSSTWRHHNPHAAQQPAIRIEALQSVASYDAGENPLLADFADVAEFSVREAAEGVTVDLQRADPPGDQSGDQSGDLPDGQSWPVGRLQASRAAGNPGNTWARVGRVLTPPMDLREHQGMGLWIHGDAGGQLLNVQLRSPEHLSHAIGEHYVPIDFAGWRYVELVEPEGERFAEQSWPYGNMYSIYRESVQAAHIGSIDLWLNNLPMACQCYVGPVRALPLQSAILRRPSLRVGAHTVELPVDLHTGQYLEWTASGCTLFGSRGEVVRKVAVVAERPTLACGDNDIQFDCQQPDGGVRPRARVTISSRGAAPVS